VNYTVLYQKISGLQCQYNTSSTNVTNETRAPRSGSVSYQPKSDSDPALKSAESALAAHGKKWKKGKGGRDKEPEKSESDELCNNCNRPGHTKPSQIVGQRVEARKGKDRDRRSLKRGRRRMSQPL
jgi:hypothetical protein